MTALKEQSYMASSALLIVLESIISTITIFLPQFIIDLFTKATKFCFSLLRFSIFRDPVHEKLIKEINRDLDDPNSPTLEPPDNIYSRIHALQKLNSIKEMCRLFGYTLETHLVQTSDRYILTLHRLNPRRNGTSPNGRAIYLHHGLLMNSEVWCCMLDKDANLPFLLCDLGFDVWLGNNRGNKYSNKSLRYNINDRRFWDFSIDEFAIYDIPDSIAYVLDISRKKRITYIGFSQGSTQGLALLSTNTRLNSQIDKIITISPATTPRGLHNWLVNSLFKLSPDLLFLLFGKKILLTSATFWKSIIYPPLYIKIIDLSNQLLFNWKSLNIDYKQKFSSYYHLYSTTSVKSVCHWFQIIKSMKFQMYNTKFRSLYNLDLSNLEFPTDTNIEVPILIVYGKSDSLVDIEIMKTQLPQDHLKIVGVEGHEHLDLLWGRNVAELVFQNVIRFLHDDQLVEVDGLRLEFDLELGEVGGLDNIKESRELGLEGLEWRGVRAERG